jgi:TPR repeat protein
MLDDPPFRQYRPCFPEASSVHFVRFVRAALPVAVATLLLAAQPAAAGMEEAVKALQAGDPVTAEKELQLLAKERDPRAQFLLGLYVYGNAESKLFDINKATPLLLDASERGYLPAMVPLAGAYAEGKGVPKSLFEAYKWCAIADRWNVPNANLALEQAARELPPAEAEKAKAAALAYTFKTK